MQILIRPLFKLLYWSLMLVALVIGIMRVGFANIDYFKSDIEGLLRQSVLPGLSFSDIELDWNQFDHLIYVRNATLTLPNQTDSVVVKKLSLEVSLWRSLLARSLVVHKVNAKVESLHFRKDLNRHWWLSDIALNDLGSGGDNVNFDFVQILGLTPKYIHLDIKQITIDDELDKQQYKIENTVFDMQQRRGVVQAKLDTNLQDLGGQQSIQGIYRKGRGLVYSRLNQINLKLVKLMDMQPEGLQQAELSGELWMNLDGEKPPSVQADLSIKNARFQVDAKTQATPFSFNAKLDLEKMEQHWGVIAQFDQLVLNAKTVQGFDVQLDFTKKDDIQNLSGWVKKLDLSILTSLDEKLLPDDLAEKIELSRLKGEVNNVWFSFNPADFKNISLSANLDDISNSPVSGIPGFNQLSGSLVLGRQNLQLKSSGQKLTLDFAKQFRAPFKIEHYALEANASFGEAGTYVSVPKFEVSNKDISVAGRLTLNLDQADTPVMYLRANFDQGNASAKSKYLPVQLLPSSALEWLDDGIKGAKVSAGNLLYHGRLKHLRTLDREKSGEFYVDFKIDNAEVMFDPEWDSVRKAKGIISFHNLGMTADISNAHFGHIESANGRVFIPDLSEVEIDLNLNANTEATKALPTWLAMPISESFRKTFTNFKNPNGQVQADLKVVIPLNEISKSKVNVDLTLNDVSINAPVWDVELSKVNGMLQVTKDQISGEKIKAHYFNDPVTVDVKTDKTDNKTLIQANGLISTQQLMGLLPDYLSKGVTGKSDWKVQLAIDNDQNDVREPVLRVNGQSNLKNTQVSLPAPLVKSTELSRKTKVAVAIYSNDAINFGVRYGSHLLTRGDLELNGSGDEYQLKAMDIALSTSLRPHELNRGVRLYGALPKVSVDDWLDWYRIEIGQQDASSSKTSSESAWNMIKFVELQVQSALVERRRWSNVNFMLSQEAEHFLATIDSSHLKGQISLPKQQSTQNPIVANLDFLKFETLENPGPDSTLLPGNFYNLSLTSKAASYDDYNFENLQLEAQLNSNVFAIDKVSFRRDKVFLQGKGQWEYEPKGKTHVTSFDFSVKGSQFGQTMADLGLGDAISGGKINFNSHLSWSKSLLNFDWDSLTGDARLVIDDGILKDVEPGSGRLIGLLSLNALPRRLLLGFSDVVGKGMEFEKIAGTYTVTGENLYTGNTRMDGPSAKVLVTGTTGLRSQNYDQKMFITPKVRQTLPVIGGIAAGSAVGWGLLLVQRLFKSAIDKTVEIEYTIKGSWDDPQIVLVEKTKSEQGIVERDK